MMAYGTDILIAMEDVRFWVYEDIGNQQYHYTDCQIAEIHLVKRINKKQTTLHVRVGYYQLYSLGDSV